jgi:hypothetical protein
LQVHPESNNWQKLCWQHCGIAGLLCKCGHRLIDLLFVCVSANFSISNLELLGFNLN